MSLRKWVLFTIQRVSGALVTAFPLLATTVGGSELGNTLFPEIVLLLALFGGQVAKQFISQLAEWADSILFAMASLGVVAAATTGAFRVAGPPVLEVLVGRARENRATAGVDLMSSTSHDVSELWNNQMAARAKGSPPLLELIILPSRKDEVDCGLFTLGEPTECLGKFRTL